MDRAATAALFRMSGKVVIMEIQLLLCTDDKKIFPKHFTVSGTLTGSIRGEISVENPVVRIENMNYDFNYVYIPEFSRYYYVEDKNHVRTDIVDLTLVVDVLQSHYTEFIQCPMIAARSENTYNRFLPDRQRAFEQRPINEYIHIGEFNQYYTVVMVTVG